MKKILLGIICLFVHTISMQAQTLYCTTPQGGNDGGGTINKLIPAANKLIVSKSFESFDNGVGYVNFTQASDGKLYGMTTYGGSYGVGFIFSFNPASSTYTKLQNFNNTNGANPEGSLVQATDGKLYGMTNKGGSNGVGVIFSFDPSSSTYTKLKDFDKNHGANPYGNLIQARDGKLYGMTSGGGSGDFGGYGVIFSFDPSSFAYTKLKDFHGDDGGVPLGSLLEASDKKLYGMTQTGSSGHGLIFSFDPSSSTYKKLKDLNDTIGGDPNGSLIEANDGKLYGTTLYGGSGGAGVIFSFDPSSSIYTGLKDFDGTDGAAYPYGSLVQTSDGKLYGQTGGGNGLIFSFDPSSSAYKKVKDVLAYGLIQASDGKLYGVTQSTTLASIIFSVDPVSSAYSTLKDIASNESGSNVSSGLLQAKDGKLYGMTSNGGSNGAGVIFSFDPSSSIYKKLKDFDGKNGANPFGGLIEASDGKLYGMTHNGGSNGRGVIFSFDPSSSAYTKLKDFDFYGGYGPYGSLVQASDGKLYGMTNEGGGDYETNQRGVIFSFDPSSFTYTKLKDFDYTHGGNPYGNLIQAKDGKLYGMTFSTIFSFDLHDSDFTELMQFNKLTGNGPLGSLIQAADGKLYGITSNGDFKNLGVIFSFDLSSSTYSILKRFVGSNGASPQGSLTQASDGKLYGMTNAGGSSKLGVIFSYDPSSSTYTKLKDYNGANGASPSYGSAFIEVKDNQNAPPTVSLTAPNNNANYLAPAAHIRLRADASDLDGTITKVEFYNGPGLLHTETIVPYGFVWKNVPLGNYTITAKAYDNSGNVTTSAPIHISVVPNKPPAVSIISPANNQTFVDTATIRLVAAAADTDGRITRVEFYNGTTLLRTEYKYPYTYNWTNVPAGTYTVTAVATDNWGAQTTSAPVTVRVTSASAIVSSRPYSENQKASLNDAVSLRLSPNPASNILNIYTSGLQPNKPATISIISVSGIELKTMQISNSSNQLDVSSLVSGVYTIKIISGNKVMYRQFVKL